MKQLLCVKNVQNNYYQTQNKMKNETLENVRETIEEIGKIAIAINNGVTHHKNTSVTTADLIISKCILAKSMLNREKNDKH